MTPPITNDPATRVTSLGEFDEFLNFLAHELRNQLAPISTGVQVMEMLGSDLPDELLRVRDLMGKQLSKVLGLVNEVLELTRISGGKVVLQVEPVDVFPLVSQAVAAHEAGFTERDIHFTSNLERGSRWASGDSARLSWSLFTLFDFVQQCAKPGAHVEVTSELVPGEVCILIRVEPGAFSAGELVSLFDCFAPGGFHRACGELTLALTLARKVIELHGGQLGATCEDTVTNVTLRVPATAPASTASAAPAKPPASSESRRVLIIDDNREAADMLARLATALGHEARTAYGGAAGIKAAKDFAPHLVLLDLQLPDINGLEVGRQIRLADIERPLLAALTGNDGDEDRRRCAQAGFDQFFVKPVRLDDLRRLTASVATANVS